MFTTRFALTCLFLFTAAAASADVKKLPDVWNAYCLLTPQQGLNATPVQSPVEIHYGETKQLFVVKGIAYSLAYKADLAEPYVIEMSATDLSTKKSNTAYVFSDEALPARIDLEANDPAVSLTCFKN